MCDPTTLIIIGSLVTAGGIVQTGIAANKVGKANSRIQQIMADDARLRGAADEASHRRAIAAFKGKQAATFGASGGEINTGSALTILADTAQIGELEALRIRNNAEREAFAFEAGAAISRAEGRNALTSSIFSAGGTLITAAGTVSGRFKTFKATKGNEGATFGQFLKAGG